MRTFIVDSFTDQPFAGNPAGVCLLDPFTSSEIRDERMQAIAKELNFSETAFVRWDGGTNYFIRYFSPIMEIPLCGHATLAASKVIFDLNPTHEAIHFHTIEKLNLVSKLNRDGKIQMKFPLYDVEPFTVPDELVDALRIETVLHCAFNQETQIVLLEIEDTVELKQLEPDFDALLASHDSIQGVVVTAKSKSADFDFHSRFFWPWSGGNEDPVTGVTHTFLAKYWGDKLDKTKLNAHQSSERTGSMELKIVAENTLLINANAVVLFDGQWTM